MTTVAALWRRTTDVMGATASLWSARPGMFAGLVVLSIAGKLALASLGHNYDVDSWQLVGQITAAGRSVYAETARYNYGPLWFWVCAAADHCARHFPVGAGAENFHLWLVLVLSVIDAGVAVLLRRMGLGAPAVFFVLNPLTWLISGFHSQFDQFPILIGLVAVSVLARRQDARAVLMAAVILGLSLAVKHTLIFLPAWLALWLLTRDRRNVLGALVMLLLPPLLFALTFAPYWLDPASRAGIVANVLHYRSDYLYALVPLALSVIHVTPLIEHGLSWVPIFSGYRAVWVLVSLAFAYPFRAARPVHLLALYTCVLVIFTPAMADQYLVIPALACALYWRSWLTWAYVTGSTAFLLLVASGNVGGLPGMHAVHASFAWLPLRRYMSVAFLFIFLIQMVRREDVDRHLDELGRA